MSIHEKINRAIEKIESGDIEEKASYGDLTTDLGSALYSQTVIPKTKTSEYLRSAIGWVYGCVNVIADEVASINLRMLRFKNNETTEVDDHPAMDVIYRANNAMTRFDLIQLTFQYLELAGEAPWFISFKNGKPDQIFLLRPDRLTVLPGKDGELIGGYKYRVQTDSGYHELELEPFEVVPIRYCDPDNPVRGKGPLQAAARTFDLDNYAEKWNSQFFANSASPAAAFQTDKTLGKEIRQRLETKIKEKYQGIKNAHKTLILEGGLKYQQLSLSQKDMDFVSQQHFSRDKMLAIFRVPPTALGLTADVTRANAEATDYVFAKRTISPKMRRFVEQLNEFFLPLFGVDTNEIYFDFDDPVPQNVDQNIAKAASGVQNGFMTINEAREVMGLDPIEDGDILRDPSSMQPVLNFNQQPIKAKKKKNKPKPYYKHMDNARNRSKRKAKLQRKAIEKVVQNSLVPIIENMLLKKAKSSSSPKIISAVSKSVLASGTWEEVKAAKYEFQAKQLNLADEYEKSFIAKLNSVFRAQEAIILRGLDNGEKMKLNVDVERERYEDALRAPFISLMRKQAGLAFQFLGIQKTFTKADQTFLQTLLSYYGDRTFVFSGQVTQETNDKLSNAFREAAEAQESIPQIKSRIRDLFDNMESYRSERIARSETIRASNYATEQAYIESDVVEVKEWLTIKDERTDDACMAMDGKTVALGDNFFDKGDKFMGLDLNYENVGFPPLHVNCRCTLIPVLKTPFKDGEWRPTMNSEQAAAFIKGSVNKETWYHGTNGKAADNIRLNGFIPSKNIMGPEAIYLAKDTETAAKYGRAASQIHKDPTNEVLKIKLNIKKLKVFETESEYLDAIERQFGDWTKEGMTAFNNQWDAVLIRKTDRYLNYMMVRDPRNVVVLR